MFETIKVSESFTDEFVFIDIVDKNDMLAVLYNPDIFIEFMNDPNNSFSLRENVSCEISIDDIKLTVRLHENNIRVYHRFTSKASHILELYEVNNDTKEIKYIVDDYKSYIHKIIMTRINRCNKRLDFYNSLLPDKKRVN